MPRRYVALLAVTVLALPALAQEQKKGTGRELPARLPARAGGTIVEEQDKEVATPPPAFKPGEPAPVITALEPVHDFGTTWAGPKLETTFEVKNEGPVPLDILKVRTSCGCTIAGQHPQKIMPGEIGKFPFSINSDKLRGKYEKTATIMSNDPVTPNLKLQMRGVCNRYLDIMPTNANFGKLTGNAPQQRVLKIANNTETPAQLTVEPEQIENVTFKLVETEPGKNFELVVTVTPPFKPGMLNAEATLHSNLPEQLRTTISARAKVPERLEVSPEIVTLNLDKDTGQPFKRPLRFTNYGEQPVNLLEATIDDPEIKVTIAERTDGKAYTVYLEVPSGYKPTNKDRTITLKTDDPAQPEVKALFRASSESLAAKPPQEKPTPQRRPAEELVGQPAPAFSLKTLDGREVSNQAAANAITVLDFFAPNCPHCKKQMPKLEPLRKEYESKGVRFVAVSQTMGGKKFTDQDVTDVVKQTGFAGELVTDHDNTVGPLFQATGFPTLVVLGKTGKVESVHVGNKGDLDTVLKGEFEALLAGKPLPKVETVAQKPAPAKEDLVGKPAPAFTAQTIAGAPLSNNDLSGKVTVLDFFAANCPHCIKQLPRVEQIRQAYEAKGVRFVAVSQTMRTKFSDDDVKAKLKEANFAGELVIDPDNKIGPLFQATGFPTMAIVGKDGKLAALNVGNSQDLEERMKGQLDALIAGQPIPDQWVAKAPAPQPPAPPKQELVGKPAPAFTAQTIAGAPISNNDLSGKVTVLDFFAANCPHCNQQLPRVEQIRQAYEAKGVRFVAVSQTMRTKFSDDDIKAKLKEANFGGELVIDPDNKIGPLFQATGFPTMAIVGKDGKIAALNVGNSQDLEDRMKGQLDALVAGQPIPDQWVAKAPAPQPPAPPKQELLGKPAPAFTAQTIAGAPISNTDLGGKVTVLDFFAANCPHCNKQLPRVEQIRQSYEAKGVRFVAVSQTMRTKFSDEDIQAKLKEANFAGELVIDPDNKIGPLFQATGFPTMAIVGKDGNVAALNVGNMQDLEDRMKGQLDALIAGQPIPDQWVSKAPSQQPQRRPAEEMVGQPAPAFAIATLDNKPVGDAEFGKYKATVLNFVAPNCGFCKKQVPNVDKVRQEYESKGVRFVNVAQKMRKDYTVEETVQVFAEAGSKLEMATDFSNTVGNAYKATSFPTMVVVDGKGSIAHVNIGAKPDIDTILKGQLDTLIKKADSGA